MKKITTISQQQIEQFPSWVKKWTEIGLSTEPADFGLATDAALRAYKLRGLAEPMVVLRMSSPYGATVGGATAVLMLKELGSKVWEQVGEQVWAQVRSQVESQVWAQVRSQIESQVGEQPRC